MLTCVPQSTLVARVFVEVMFAVLRGLPKIIIAFAKLIISLNTFRCSSQELNLTLGLLHLAELGKVCFVFLVYIIIFAEKWNTAQYSTVE